MSRTSERRARRAAAQRKEQRNGLLQNRTLWIYGGIALIVLTIAAFSLANRGAAATPTPSAATPGGTLAPVAVGTEVAVPNMGGQHVAQGQAHAAYNSTPPTSGPHYD